MTTETVLGHAATLQALLDDAAEQRDKLSATFAGMAGIINSAADQSRRRLLINLRGSAETLTDMGKSTKSAIVPG